MQAALSVTAPSKTPRLRLPSLLSLWKVGLISVGLVFTLPLWVIVSYLLIPEDDVWQHLAETVLSGYLSNTLLLSLGVGLGVLLMGIPAAWLTSMCDFPLQRFFTWSLLLPLAMPAYIIAYTYTGLLDFAGPIQNLVRDLAGWRYGDYWFPEIRSLGGAIAMLSLVLFPYVYLLARAAFLEQSLCVLEVSRTLGCNAWQSFYRVALPLARPAIITGLSLALMETLADFGTVQYFGVDTFTTGIFRTWFGLGNAAAAAQLSALLLGFVFVLLVLERWSRQRARYHHTTNKYARLKRYQLRGWSAGLAVLFCSLLVSLGFLIPIAQLLYWGLFSATTRIDGAFIELVWHSLSLATMAALLTLGLALLLGYGKRIYPSKLLQFTSRLAGMGYALPGTVLAIGLLIPLAWLDNQLNAGLQTYFNRSWGLVLSGSLFTLLCAYSIRFLSVSLQTVESGLGKIKPSLDNAGRSLGLKAWEVLARIHLPLMKASLLTALLLVFVDVLKELPATLLMRPFNFNTLAVRAHELASDERLADAGLPALMIVAAGIIPVILLSRSISRARAGDSA
ncbi:ABC transporter permease [Thiolinea disciformis]|uniref:ABC transporter permease n=1 Tax=Thiolinea disciformis TaxID=125614 RepID=UPI00037BB62A|nr:iron ABC transporter permease [Thiolinea disciformis]